MTGVLLEPTALGRTTARNRLVFGPHETNLCAGRAIGARHVDYYRRRAVGGVGVIVTETASVHPSDWPYERCPDAAASGEGWAAVAAACRDEGALVVAGLGHAGMQGSSAYHQRETWGPSSVPDAITREMPKVMEAEDIDAVIAGFAGATKLAVDAGVDGVELNAGQHSLIRQFLSGLTNMRGDEWGPGDDGAGRIRFATAVLDAVRAAAGDAIVGLRLSCDELAPWAGLTPESAAEVAATLAPLVDYLVVVRGSIFSADATRPDGHEPAGFNLDLAGTIRGAVDGACPVVAQGSIIDPGQAAWAVEDGRADLVEMTRAQIADPDLAAKLAGSVPGAVRPCLLCNQKCRVRDARNPILSCVVEPSAGHEAGEPEMAAPVPASVDRRVIVVGAGPAGLECARVAAAAGASVRVVEARDVAGSVVRDLAAATGRGTLEPIVDWLVAECERLGVTVDYGHEATAVDVAEWRAAGATVVVCTGSREPDVADGAVTAAAVVAAFRAGEILGGAAPVADGPVLVWDPVGGPIAVSIAETLARAVGGRHDVHFACPDVTAGTQLSLTGDLAAASTRMLQAGVTIHRHSRLTGIDATVDAGIGSGSDGLHTARLVDRFTDVETTIDVATVVDCSTHLPADELWAAVGEDTLRAGDAVAPRTVFEAILEGRRTAVAALG